MIEGGEGPTRGADQLELLALTAGIQNAGEICRYESGRKSPARGLTHENINAKIEKVIDILPIVPLLLGTSFWFLIEFNFRKKTKY